MVSKSTQGKCFSGLPFFVAESLMKKNFIFKTIDESFFVWHERGWWFEKFYVQWIKKMVVVDLSAELELNHENWHKKATAQSSRRL